MGGRYLYQASSPFFRSVDEEDEDEEEVELAAAVSIFGSPLLDLVNGAYLYSSM